MYMCGGCKGKGRRAKEITAFRYDASKGLTDASISGKGGLELLSDIKSDPHTSDVETIVLTGLEDQDLKRKALDLGAVDLLSKPVMKEDFIARINNALRTKSYRDQLLDQNMTHKAAISKLSSQPDKYNPKVVAVLDNILIEKTAIAVKEEVKEITVDDLKVGMVANDDILAKSGALLVPKGEDITYPALVCLKNFAQGVGVNQPFKVRISA